jgi:hypothetical protein
VVFGLKKPSMSVKNLFFAWPLAMLPLPPLFSIIGSGKRRYDVLPAPLLLFFTPAAFYFFLIVISELGSYFLAQGTFKKSMEGVTPTIAT